MGHCQPLMIYSYCQGWLCHVWVFSLCFAVCLCGLKLIKILISNLWEPILHPNVLASLKAYVFECSTQIEHTNWYNLQGLLRFTEVKFDYRWVPLQSSNLNLMTMEFRIIKVKRHEVLSYIRPRPAFQFLKTKLDKNKSFQRNKFDGRQVFKIN